MQGIDKYSKILNTIKKRIKIINKLRGTNDIKLLLEKDAGHRLSETNQLENIRDIIEEIKTKI